MNAATTDQNIEFLDDALGRIYAKFPAVVKVQLDNLSPTYTTLSSVGENPIEITIQSLPAEIMKPPLKFVSFVVGDNFIQTHIIDHDGTEVLIDGKLAEQTSEFLITKDLLLKLAAFNDAADCLIKKTKYRILRDNNNGLCQIEYMNGEIGGRTLMGSYDTLNEATHAMQEMLNDGRCGPPPEP